MRHRTCPSPLVPILVLVGALLAAPASAEWSADSTLGTRVCAAPGDQIEPLMVADEVGGFIMLWLDYRKPGNDPDLYGQRVDADGDTLWGAGGLVVCDAVGLQLRPTLIADGHGGAFMAWVDLRSSGSFGYYLQHIAANGVRRWAANGIRPVSGLNSSYGPKLCRDTTGGVFLAFASGNPGTQVQRIDSLGVARLGFFPPAEGPVLRANPSAPLAIVADGHGGAIVAVGYGGSGLGDLAAQRVSATGALTWGGGAGVTVCAATGAQGPVDMVPDGAGGAILAWDDSRVASTDIYAQRIDAVGAVQWTADGLALCSAAQIQSGVQLRALAGGGAVALWRDYRALPATSLHAQRVAGDGTLAWTADGVPISSSLLAIDRYALAPGEGDTTYVAWTTTSSSGGDVFAQKFDGGGATHWGAYATTVCRGPDAQQYATAADDGLGGLFVGYRDARVPGDADLYAQHLKPDGLPGPTLVDAPMGPAAGAHRLRSAPNPARGSQVITFARPASAGDALELIDLRGRRRATRRPAAGATSWTWDGRGDDGARVEPGIYFVRVIAAGSISVARVVRLE
jgi:hypothetical protein